MSVMIESVLQDIGHIQNIVAAIIATGAAVFYNVLKHRHDKDIFKRELFFKLNERYEKIQDGLEKILSWEISVNNEPQGGPTFEDELDNIFCSPDSNPTERLGPIYRYIQLCSEQYYWYQKGFIEERVWKSWHDAMIKWHSYSLAIRVMVDNERERKITYYNDEFLSLFPNWDSKPKVA